MKESVQSLVDFVAPLGLAAEDLSNVETPDRLHHTFPVASQSVAELELFHVRSLLNAFPEGAVHCEFRSGDLLELEIDQGVTDEAIQDFLGHITEDSYDLVLDVRKQRLINELFGDRDADGVILFLFERSFQQHLRAGLAEFEEKVWPSPHSKLLILVADSDVMLEGEWLNVVGGEQLDRAPELKGRAAGSLGAVEAMAEARDRYIGWDAVWTKQLTPLHFRVTGTSDSANLLGLINAQFVKLAVLYTCDRARHRQGSGGAAEIWAEFRGREHLAAIPINEGEALLEVAEEDLAAVSHMVEWCYRTSTGSKPDWVADRLPFVQTRVAQVLEGRPEERRFRDFVQAMPYLVKGLEWHWKAFVEGKVSDYLDRAQQVETLVADTVDRLSEQVSSLVKQLSDTMLAAVAVVVGTFIAAAFKDPFNALLFQIGLLTYAGYVGVFPGIAGTYANYGNFSRALDGFQLRRERFAETLLPDKVDEIVKTRVRDAAERYFRTLGLVALAYTLVVIAAIVAAYRVPALVA